MKVKVTAKINLIDIPTNFIEIEVPDNDLLPEETAKKIIYEQLINGGICIKTEDNLLPKCLIKSIDVNAIKM